MPGTLVDVRLGCSRHRYSAGFGAGDDQAVRGWEQDCRAEEGSDALSVYESASGKYIFKIFLFLKYLIVLICAELALWKG